MTKLLNHKQRTFAPIIVLTTLCFGSLPSTYGQVTSPTTVATTESAKSSGAESETGLNPIDMRADISSDQFKLSGSGEWISPWEKPEHSFDELIYSWNCRPGRDEGFRLFLQVRFSKNDDSPWLYAGYWGRVPFTGERKEPEFDRGKLELDQLLLHENASHWRFKVVSEGKQPLAFPPSLHVIATSNKPDAKASADSKRPSSSVDQTIILDVPHRRQQDTDGNPLKDRCQSAAVASAMQYFGTTVPLEQVIAFTTDPEYKSFGIWPRTIGAAHEFGFEGYIDRFRNWDYVRETIAQNKVILCSIKMPKNDSYIAPPYPSIGGHIVALCGITDDGRVIITDSASSTGESGYLCQWKREDFEKIWMRNKGGVGMVIFKSVDKAGLKLVEKLPPFPDRTTSTTLATAQ